MRRSSRQERVIPEAEMNLTPLIDVVFVVLIIFIIIAPMLEIDRVELANAAPTKQNAAAPESSSITIHVKQDNTIWYGGRLVTIEQLTQILRDVRKTGNRQVP